MATEAPMVPARERRGVPDAVARRVQHAVRELAAGRMVALCGSPGPGEIGNLVAAADRISPAAVAFMAAHARGLIRLAVTGADCERLGLRHQSSVVALDRRRGEQYLAPIEARRGGTTGISAADRANTLRTAATGTAADLVSPGHIVPTLVSPTRLGGRHAAPAAAVELCRWAGVAPLAALCHVLDADGGPARAPEMRRLASQFALPWLTIDDIAATMTGSESGSLDRRRSRRVESHN